MRNYTFTKLFPVLIISSIIFSPLSMFAQTINRDSDSAKWLERNDGATIPYNEDDYADDLRPLNTNPGQDRKPAQQKGTADYGLAKCTLAEIAKNIGAKAFGGFVDGLAASVTNPNLVPVIDVLNTRKEVGLGGGYGPSTDSIAFCIINSVIQYISDATIDWINNGFEGNPVFITDPSRLVKDIAKDTTNAFIDSIGNGILCERFKLDITFALVRNWKSNKKIVPDRCTLEEAQANIDRILSGQDFSFELLDVVTSNPNNNVIGAYLNSQSSLDNVIDQRTDTVFIEAGWGDGFLSWKNEQGETVTPSKLIADTLIPEKLNLATNRLVIADEFDEIMDALVNQLIKMAANEVLGS